MLEGFLAQFVFLTLVTEAIAVTHQAWLNYRGIDGGPTTVGISPFKYQCRLLGALFWFLYGWSLDVKDWPLVFGVPLFGTACAVVLVQVLLYPPSRSRGVTKLTIVVLVLTCLTGIGLVMGILDVASIRRVVQWLPLGAALVFYVPGQTKQILLNKSRQSVQGLSLFETSWGFVNESIWLLYGLAKAEWSVWLPCIITAGLFALTLFQFYYYKGIGTSGGT